MLVSSHTRAISTLRIRMARHAQLMAFALLASVDRVLLRQSKRIPLRSLRDSKSKKIDCLPTYASRGIKRIRFFRFYDLLRFIVLRVNTKYLSRSSLNIAHHQQMTDRILFLQPLINGAPDKGGTLTRHTTPLPLAESP